MGHPIQNITLHYGCGGPFKAWRGSSFLMASKRGVGSSFLMAPKAVKREGVFIGHHSRLQ